MLFIFDKIVILDYLGCVMLEALKLFLLQVGLILLPFVLIGFLISRCARVFYGNFGQANRFVVYFTGFFGTPVHECAHALFCLIFLHKITDIKLFQINSKDGTLGYVNHSYNKKSFYQRLGNFFIGIAPLVVISALLVLIAFLLLPKMLGQIAGVISGAEISFSLSTLAVFGEMFKVIGSYMVDYHFWIFVVIATTFALHMNLSRADINGAFSGLVFLLVLALIADIVLALVGVGGSVLEITYLLSFAVISVLGFALLVSVIALLLSFVIKLVFRIK